MHCQTVQPTPLQTPRLRSQVLSGTRHSGRGRDCERCAGGRDGARTEAEEGDAVFVYCVRGTAVGRWDGCIGINEKHEIEKAYWVGITGSESGKE